MATLERPRPEATTAPSDASFATTAVPSPFPEHAAIRSNSEGSRGRTMVPGPSHRQAVADQDDVSASRSPNGSRSGLSRVVGQFKRAMSASRDRSGESQDRGRRTSVDTAVQQDEPRGRSPLSAFQPRSVSRGPSTHSIQTNADGSSTMYPLSKSQTRSSSRGRAPPGGKVFSTGRGGAGNLIGVARDEDMTEFNGEEDANVVRAVKEERSRSRERMGRTEVGTTGRGGRGNIRSASRGRDLELGRVPTVLEEQERAANEDEELRYQEVLRKRERDGPDHYVSSGRGGAGNIFSTFRRAPSQSR
ncbi:hypothetical protein JCM8208_000757 [Rhodotorula glutinis]